MLVYKIDVMEALREAGYTPGRIRREKLLPENALTKIRAGEMIGSIVLDRLCALLDMQPGNIIKYKENGSPEK